MDHRTASEILEAIEGSRSDRKRDAILSGIRYARLRTDWCRMTQPERAVRSDERRRAHDSFIDDLDILSRQMAGLGEDNSWRAVLGDDRRRIGDFACFVHCILGIRAR